MYLPITYIVQINIKNQPHLFTTQIKKKHRVININDHFIF